MEELSVLSKSKSKFRSLLRFVKAGDRLALLLAWAKVFARISALPKLSRGDPSIEEIGGMEVPRE